VATPRRREKIPTKTSFPDIAEIIRVVQASEDWYFGGDIKSLPRFIISWLSLLNSGLFCISDEMKNSSSSAAFSGTSVDSGSPKITYEAL
jgi:hypothetical protein